MYRAWIEDFKTEVAIIFVSLKPTQIQGVLRSPKKNIILELLHSHFELLHSHSHFVVVSTPEVVIMTSLNLLAA